MITGSSGQLGRKLVEHLKVRKYNVTGIDVISSSTTNKLIDIRDIDKVNKVTTGIDAIIHTASIHGKHYELNYPKAEFIKTNIDGTFNLLNVCVLNGIKKFLYTDNFFSYSLNKL